MARTPRTVVTGAVQAVVRQWERVPIRTQGRVTVALPLVAVIISAALAISGNSQRVALETDIQRKFETSAALGEIESLMVNAETGMRGYLLTGRDEFLEPFDQAYRALPASMGQLTDLITTEPEDGARAEGLRRLADVRSLAQRQMADLAYQRDLASSGVNAAADPRILTRLDYGKGLMDGIRADVAVMQARERALLDDRIDDINDIRVRDYVSVALALVAAVVMRFVAWFLFRRGVLLRVERLTTSVRGLRRGSPEPLPPPTKRDKMGELEREIHLLGN